MYPKGTKKGYSLEVCGGQPAHPSIVMFTRLLGLTVAAAALSVAQGQIFQPFPLVSNLTVGSLTSAVFGSSVHISVTSEALLGAAGAADSSASLPAADTGSAGACAEGSVCAAVIRRYRQLFAIKTSANGERSACPANVTINEIAVSLGSPSDDLGPDTDESYELSVTPFVAPGAHVTVAVTARTIYGAKHALEVLAQMVGDDANTTPLTESCGNAGWLAATPLFVSDRPVNSHLLRQTRVIHIAHFTPDSGSADNGVPCVFLNEFGPGALLFTLDNSIIFRSRYRGFMIDSGRHFLSIPRIKKTIDGLSMLRLNVLHWHITDSTYSAQQMNQMSGRVR